MTVSYLLRFAVHAAMCNHPVTCSDACEIVASEMPAAKLISLLVIMTQNLLQLVQLYLNYQAMVLMPITAVFLI